MEALMGHEGYFTEAYRRFSDDQLASLYKKSEYLVTVFGRVERSDDLNSVVIENIKMRSENEQLKHKMDEISNWVDEMKLTYIDVWEEMRVRVRNATGRDPTESVEVEASTG